MKRVNLDDLRQWCISAIEPPIRRVSVRHIIKQVLDSEADFIQWPKRGLLLWQGCVRESGKHHKYPSQLREQYRECCDETPNTLVNGPAIAAFTYAKGYRPFRSNGNGWDIYHIYNGKHPYVDRMSSLHGVKDGNHFTQAAGLIAAHPVAKALADEDAGFAWFLRAKAFSLFHYDPDHVFSDEVGDLGFTGVQSVEIVEEAQ